jgi:hypothetical protein
MQPVDYLTLHRWLTPCSDAPDLYFHRLVDEGNEIRVVVRDDKSIYEFCFANGPYQVADEAHLRSYQIESNPRKTLQAQGWTYLVTNSAWAKSFNQGTLDVFFPDGYQHYFIATWDSCLDILTNQPPTIQVTEIMATK